MNKSRKLVLNPSDTAQWHALVCDAEHCCAHHLDENLESYLVFLLMRFNSKPKIASSILAFDFFNTVDEGGQSRLLKLRDLGDKSLLLSGLFPGLADRKRVSVNYFVNMGQSAYSVLARLEETTSNVELFSALCIEFNELVNVLQAMRDNSDAAVTQWINLYPELETYLKAPGVLHKKND